jgi:hypothetical protein
VDKLQPEEINVDLKILASIIETLPPEIQTALNGALHQVNITLNRKRRVIEMVNSSLGQLRLDMKYLMFDLEATRRERDELKRELGK